MDFFAAVSMNLQDLACDEARETGLDDVRKISGGIHFSGEFKDGMRYCMNSRFATRLMLKLHECDVENAEALHETASLLELEKYFGPDNSFVVTNTVISCNWLKSTMLASQVVKDGICDRQRKLYGRRSDINRDSPDFTVHLFIEGNHSVWYIDFSGQSLSKRHYRIVNTPVYLQEHTSAALVKRSLGKEETVCCFADPFCGSGTILIEAALIASDTAPGLVDTERFSFLKFPQFSREEWDAIIEESRKRSEAGRKKLEERFDNGPFLFGFDNNAEMIEAARANATAAGMDEFIEFRQLDINDMEESDIPSGCSRVITDPPYGERMKVDNIENLYYVFGQKLNGLFGGCNVSVLAGDNELLSNINLKPNRVNTLMNGSIKCQVAHYYVLTAEERENIEKHRQEEEEELRNRPLSQAAQSVYNRLVKNRQSLAGFLKDNKISCYRLYDADIPEYAAIVDIYENKFAVIQEKSTTSDHEQRMEDIKVAVMRTLDIPSANVFMKKRERMKGASQYSSSKSKGTDYIARENGLNFTVNFTDHIDTGLFLDHRYIRSYIRQKSENARFLNLFCYTGSATVYAAKGGALSTVSVDASAAYLDIAKKNLQMNGFTLSNNFYYRKDAGEYLRNLHDSDVFDLIFLDPPTFSNSKDRPNFDVQRDHVFYITQCMRHLSNDGELIFSTNFRNFKMDDKLSSRFDVEDISEKTIDEDFRDRNIHKVFLIHRKNLEMRSIKEIAREIRSM